MDFDGIFGPLRSDSKKSWCCEKTHRGCVKFHCFHGEATTWSSDTWGEEELEVEGQRPRTPAILGMLGLINTLKVT